ELYSAGNCGGGDGHCGCRVRSAAVGHLHDDASRRVLRIYDLLPWGLGGDGGCVRVFARSAGDSAEYGEEPADVHGSTYAAQHAAVWRIHCSLWRGVDFYRPLWAGVQPEAGNGDGAAPEGAYWSVHGRVRELFRGHESELRHGIRDA